jgi:hypothetical protein
MYQYIALDYRMRRFFTYPPRGTIRTTSQANSVAETAKLRNKKLEAEIPAFVRDRTSRWQSRIPATAWIPKRYLTPSSHFSRPRSATRAPAWDFPRRTESSSKAAAPFLF